MSGIGVIILPHITEETTLNAGNLVNKEDLIALRQTVLMAIKLRTSSVTVLGANYDLCKSTIDDLNTEILFNLDWRKGPGSSIKFGFSHLHKSHPDLDAVIILESGNSLAQKDTLQQMIDAFAAGHSIVCCSNHSIQGAPILFGRNYFRQMLKIGDADVAYSLLKTEESFAVKL